MSKERLNQIDDVLKRVGRIEEKIKQEQKKKSMSMSRDIDGSIIDNQGTYVTAAAITGWTNTGTTINTGTYIINAGHTHSYTATYDNTTNNTITSGWS